MKDEKGEQFHTTVSSRKCKDEKPWIKFLEDMQIIRVPNRAKIRREQSNKEVIGKKSMDIRKLEFSVRKDLLNATSYNLKTHI